MGEKLDATLVYNGFNSAFWFDCVCSWLDTRKDVLISDYPMLMALREQVAQVVRKRQLVSLFVLRSLPWNSESLAFGI
jgi:hypothetical protein